MCNAEKIYATTQPRKLSGTKLDTGVYFDKLKEVTARNSARRSQVRLLCQPKSCTHRRNVNLGGDRLILGYGAFQKTNFHFRQIIPRPVARVRFAGLQQFESGAPFRKHALFEIAQIIVQTSQSRSPELIAKLQETDDPRGPRVKGSQSLRTPRTIHREYS
jgi:hypothetical protein